MSKSDDLIPGLRFRGLLKTSAAIDRPIQSLAPTKAGAIEWANTILTQHPDRKDWGPDAKVEIYETREELVETVRAQ